MPRDNKLKMTVDGVGLLSRATVGLKSAEVLVQPQAGGQKKILGSHGESDSVQYNLDGVEVGQKKKLLRRGWAGWCTKLIQSLS